MPCYEKKKKNGKKWIRYNVEFVGAFNSAERKYKSIIGP